LKLLIILKLYHGLRQCQHLCYRQLRNLNKVDYEGYALNEAENMVNLVILFAERADFEAQHLTLYGPS